MIALSDVVIVAAFAAIASIITAVIGLIGIYYTKGNRKAILGEVQTGNDHTAGESLTRLEDMAWKHEQRLDGVEVITRETRDILDDHVEGTRALIDDFVALQPKLHALADGDDHP